MIVITMSLINLCFFENLRGAAIQHNPATLLVCTVQLSCVCLCSITTMKYTQIVPNHLLSNVNLVAGVPSVVFHGMPTLA